MKDEQLRQKIGEQIRKQREEQGWEVEQVATMAGVKALTIQKIEQGQISLPLDILAKVANVLNLKIELNAL